MSSIPTRLEKFFASPLNRTGLVLWGAGLVETVVSKLHAHTFSLPVFAAFAAGGLIAIIAPDNTVVKADVEALVEDAVEVAVARKLSAAPTIVTDAEKVITDITSPTTVTTTTTVKS